MAANVDPDEIRGFIREYRTQAYQCLYFDYGNEPRWSPQVTGVEALEDGKCSSYDDGRSAYTTSTMTSRAHTARSASPSSVFSRQTDDRSSLGGHTAPSVGTPPLPFIEPFGVPGHTPMLPGQILWCEFSQLLHCPATFRLDDIAGWIQHHIDHLGGRFPREFMCWFCDYYPFVATQPGERPMNFERRMQHVRNHIFDDYRLTYEDTRPDFFLIAHLHANGLLDDDTYSHAMSYNEAPAVYQCPGTHSNSSPSSSRPLGHRSAASRECGQYYDLEKERRAERRRQRDRERERPSATRRR
ncbi:hypothetical protein VTI74DRAFT_2381 [Chaetomium olivicolor]